MKDCENLLEEIYGIQLKSSIKCNGLNGENKTFRLKIQKFKFQKFSFSATLYLLFLFSFCSALAAPETQLLLLTVTALH